MRNGFRESIELPVGQRLPLAFLLVALCPACLLSVVLADLPARLKGVIAFVVAVAAVAEAIRVRRATPDRVTLLPDGRWRLEVAGDVVEAELRRAWGASLGPVIALEWHAQGDRIWRAWLLRPSVATRDWRRLRARLRLGRISLGAAPHQQKRRVEFAAANEL